MKVRFYKVKHFWKDGNRATWLKSKEFDKELFSELKSKYEDIKYTQEKYILIKDKTLFLFYEDKKEDFNSNRPITEITALVASKNIKNRDKVYNILKQDIPNVFDDTLEYEIELDKNDIEEKSNKSILMILAALVLVSIVMYLSFDTKPEEVRQDNVFFVKSTATINEKKPIEKKVAKQKQKKELWKWSSFCKEHKPIGHKYCYEDFITYKCKNKEKNDKNYIEYINHDGCIDLENIGNVSDDTQLKSDKYLKHKKFFKDKI